MNIAVQRYDGIQITRVRVETVPEVHKVVRRVNLYSVWSTLSMHVNLYRYDDRTLRVSLFVRGKRIGLYYIPVNTNNEMPFMLWGEPHTLKVEV